MTNTAPKPVTCKYETSGGRKGYRIRFYDAEGKRRAIWLGNANATYAEQWRGHVEHLAQCAKDHSPYCAATTKWLRGLTGRERAKLETVGLVALVQPTAPAPRNEAPETLGPFVDWYVGRRKAKPATVAKWLQVQSALVRYFGTDRRLDAITAADAEAWREWLAAEGNVREGRERKGKDGKKIRGRTDLADNTVRRRTGIARQFFSHAIKARRIADNPFAGLAASVNGNEARQYFVSHEEFESLIEHSPGAEWEAVIALSRLGGMRCPSEVRRLKWEDVDFAAGRLRIHATKTEHHADGGIRYCPLFPELRPYLERLAELAKSRDAGPADYAIATVRGSEAVYRAGLLRIMKRAGLKPWPKVFHNMRASRQTELLDQFPIKDVCSWIGNSQAVAMKHYAMQRADSFARAAGIGDGGPIRGPENGKTSPFAAKTDDPQQREKPSKTRGNAIFPAFAMALPVGEEGLEPPTSTL